METRIMLEPEELKAATGFPDDYEITGGKCDQRKQIGNAVPPKLVEEITKEIRTIMDVSYYEGQMIISWSSMEVQKPKTIKKQVSGKEQVK